MILLLMGLLSDCILHPPLSSPVVKAGKALHVIQIFSNDLWLQEVMCQNSVDVPGPVAVICAENSAASIQQSIKATVKVYNSDNVMLGDVFLSLMAVTCYLQISKQAFIQFEFDVQSADGHISHYTDFAAAQTGVWAVLPLYAGLGGTILGHLLNDDLSPESLHSVCMERSPSHSLLDDECIAYRLLLEDAYSKIGSRFQSFLLKDKNNQALRFPE